MPKKLFIKKPLNLLLDQVHGENRLRRALGPVALTSLGIGCIIGTGIFVLTGVAAHDKAGPSLMLSFVVAGLACIFAALCYSELEPQRHVPIGIITSLLVCTVLYVLVTAVVTGMSPSSQINVDAPIAHAFADKGLYWAQFVISAGAIAGITGVLLVLMLSQPRVLLAMARDGLLPKKFFGAIHEKFRTPWKSTILTGVVVSALAAVIPLRILAELVNIGTLFAFIMVCLAVLIMRKMHPDAHRPFRAPLVPILGIAFCLLLMLSLPPQNWLRLLAWMLIGLVIYWFYGRKHSTLRKGSNEAQDSKPVGLN